MAKIDIKQVICKVMDDLHITDEVIADVPMHKLVHMLSEAIEEALAREAEKTALERATETIDLIRAIDETQVRQDAAGRLRLVITQTH